MRLTNRNQVNFNLNNNSSNKNISWPSGETITNLNTTTNNNDSTKTYHHKCSNSSSSNQCSKWARFNITINNNNSNCKHNNANPCR